MFPSGAAGWGLLLLRFCAAAMLVRNLSTELTSPLAIWEIIAASILAGVYCVGVFTPVNCCISGLLQVFALLCGHKPDPFQFAFSLCVTAALFLLGPGAFSLDSRLFGRRLLVRSRSD